MPMDVTSSLLETLVSDETGTKVGSALLETLVADETATKITNVLLETLVAPDLASTKIHSALLEVLVAPGYTFINSVLLEVLVAPNIPPVLETLALPVEIHVVPVQEYKPLTGIHATEVDIDGWLWDRRRLEDSRENYAQYLSTLGGHTVGLKDATKKEWWQSGVVEGCEYVDIEHKYLKDHKTWTPQVEIGSYGLLYERKQLFSDYSYTSKFANDHTADGLMFKELRSDTHTNSVAVALYKRDTAFNIYKYWDFEYVDEFTGEIDEVSDTRLDTETDGVINVNNIAERKKEFIIRDDRVILNGNHYISNYIVLSDGHPVVVPEHEPFLEGYGAGVASGRDVYLKYLPIQDGSVRVYVDELADDFVVYSETNNLAFSEPTDRHFQVDHDLGIITMAGYQAEDLILKEDINEFDTEILIYPDEETVDSYPDQGVVIIGSEEIAYYEKTRSTLSNCIRGFNGTAIAAHTSGTTIEHRKMGQGSGGHIYVEYIAVPRIEYEVTDYSIRTANKNTWLDIKPIANVETNNVLQIYPGEISLDSILLETDSPLLGGNLYGPVFYGSDVSALTATAFDANDNPVPDIDLTISIIDGTGLLNGAPVDYTDTTNTVGQIYAFYNHPLNQSQVEFTASTVTHGAGNTVITVPGLEANVSVDDIWIYQVLKHDKLVGTVGLPLEVVDEGVASLPYGLYYLDLDGVVDEDFRDGVVSITIAGVKYYRTITWLENLFDGDDVLYTRIYLDAILASATGDIAYLFEPQAIEWDASLLNGSRYILYEFSSDAIHPLTGDLGAYLPIHPDSISGNQITFVGRTLPIPAPATASNNLGAYVIIAPARVSLQARGNDPVSGRLVQSNIIRLSLELPNFFIGVDRTGPLPIPTGWTLPIEEGNLGAGLGGANFITINAQSGPAQFSIFMDMS